MKTPNWNKMFLYYYRKYKGLWIAETKVTRAISWSTIKAWHNNTATGIFKFPRVGLYKSMLYYMDRYKLVDVDAIMNHIHPMIDKCSLPQAEKNRLLEMYYVDPEEK
jgi:hypothetical protein